MAADAYAEILNRARLELSTEEQLRLVNELSRISSGRNGPRRITELRGLGKEVWNNVNPDEYIREERDSWDG